MASSEGEESQMGDPFGMGGAGEVGVHVIVVAVLEPMVPKALPLAVTSLHDGISHGFVNSVAITRETTLLLRRKSRQNAFWSGKLELKRMRKSRSVNIVFEPSSRLVRNSRLA